MSEGGAGDARKADAVGFEGVTPILRVGSLAASLEHYVKVLGFKVDWQDPWGSLPRFREGVASDHAVREGDQGHAGGAGCGSEWDA